MQSFAKRLSAVTAALVCLGAVEGRSQVTVVQPDYTMSFGAGWAILDSSDMVLAKDDGVGGLALLRSWREAEQAPLDPAKAAKILGDSLEGKLSVTRDETKTLGSHSVRILHMSYDQLARLEREAKERGRTASFKNGTLRAYHIRSGEIRVSIVGVYAIALATPFASIEQAVPSLTLSAATGVALRRGSAHAWTAAGGTLRFADMRPLAVSAHDSKGRLLAWLRREEGSRGAAWNLPSGMGPVFLAARLESGRPFPLGWWRDLP